MKAWKIADKWYVSKIVHESSWLVICQILYWNANCLTSYFETTVHYLLHCRIFSDERSIFLNNIRSIDENVLSGSDSRISETLLFGISSFNDTKNLSILNTTIDYILSTKRSDVPLTNFWSVLKHLCIESMSFKFYNLIVNSFTKFLPYYIIGLGI